MAMYSPKRQHVIARTGTGLEVAVMSCSRDFSDIPNFVDSPLASALPLPYDRTLLRQLYRNVKQLLDILAELRCCPVRLEDVVVDYLGPYLRSGISQHFAEGERKHAAIPDRTTRGLYLWIDGETGLLRCLLEKVNEKLKEPQVRKAKPNGDQFDTTEIQTDPHKPSTTPSDEGSTADQNLDRQAIGFDGEKWYVFSRYGHEWRERGMLKGISKGDTQALLEAFANGGGFLSKTTAVNMRCFSSCDAKELMAKTISPNLSRLRKAIRIKLKLSKKTDPLPWDQERKGWVAAIQVGYAVPGDQARLQFKTRQDLSPEERVDFQAE